MKLFILHLSDIHIRAEGDPVLSRAASIVAAARSLLSDVDLCLVLTTGDVAQAGAETQYVLAQSFLSAVSDGLAEALAEQGSPATVHHVLVPGNHDCDFTEPSPLREYTVKGLSGIPGLAKDAEVQALFTKVQDAYFELQAVLAPSEAADGRYGERVRWERAFTVGTETVRVQCINTAWVSRLPELYGSLYFPPDAMPLRRANDAIALAAFHHPYGWLDPEFGRPFRRSVEEVVDLVFTGHEHDPDAAAIDRPAGANTTYVEGGLLQTHSDPKDSSFNVVIIDSTAKKQLAAIFRWHDSDAMYVRDDDRGLSDGDAEPWEDFEENRLRVRGRIELSEQTRAWLDDPGMTLSRQGRPVKLSDIFVYPDLRESPAHAAAKSASKLVRSGSVADTIAARKGPVFVLGDTQSGRTSLAKALMRDLQARGRVPIYLNAAKENFQQSDKLAKTIENRAATQYDNMSREQYRQLGPKSRVLIVDDFHLVRLDKQRRQLMFDAIRRVCDLAIFLGNDLALGLDSLTSVDPALDLACYRIQQFGYRRRDELVEKWLLLGRSNSDQSDFIHTLNTITKTINTFIGRNFVPPYPPYLVSVLQAADSGTPLDTKASTHGYFYGLLIQAALARGSNAVQFDIFMAYLARLAYRAFELGAPTFSRAQFDELHHEYVALHDISLEGQATLERLVKQEILRTENDEVGFRYPYVYYYFIAAYLRDHITSESIKERIRTLSRALHVDDNANILLFLAHLSRDPMIVSEMLAAASLCYEGVQPARMEDDVRFLDSLGTQSALIDIPVYHDTCNFREARQKDLDALDGDGTATLLVPTPQEPPDPTNPIVRLGMALKTLQILGQLVKNFPGGLEGDDKARIVSACFDLGLRALGWLTIETDRVKLEFLRDCVEVIRQQQPHAPDARIREVAERALSGITFMACAGMVQRVALAVGSPDLEPTYRRLYDESNIAKRLINLTIEMERQFPIAEIKALATAVRGRQTAGRVLRFLTVQHLRLFPLDLPTKQRACAALGIQYNQAIDGEQVALLSAPPPSQPPQLKGPV